MLLWLLELLARVWPHAVSLTAWEKITLRASLGAMLSFLVAVALGPRLIAWLHRRFREPNNSPSPDVQRLHRDKEFTPTMGGLFIVAGLIGGVLIFGNLENRYLPPAIFLALGLALLGAADDLVKLRGRRNGLTARTKMAGQLVVCGAAACWLYFCQAAVPEGLVMRLPLVDISFPLGLWFIPLAVLVMVGSSNAVNLTDGLDGLAGGCLIFATAAMTLAVYAAGHAELAEYLQVARIPGAGEMTVLCGAMIGAVLGFLWFNCHPAQVFMGDTGALPLGGLLGMVALVARQELLLVVIGGVFVAEAASVILQVGYYRWRQKRIFLCAPLHHHFQLKGWAENKIVVRFWIAAALCALVGLAGLKLPVHNDAPGRGLSQVSFDENGTVPLASKQFVVQASRLPRAAGTAAPQGGCFQSATSIARPSFHGESP